MKNKGFTLIEMVVTLGIFAILIATVMNTFTKGFYSQKRIIEMQAVQREQVYIMETLSREIRVATGINASQQGLNGVSALTFNGHDGTIITYCRANVSGICDSSGTYFAVNGNVITSSDVEVTGLKFYTSQNFANTQPLVTISLRVRSKLEPRAEAALQTSVAMRLYK